MFRQHKRESSLTFGKKFIELSENDNTLLETVLSWIKGNDINKKRWIGKIGREQILKLAEENELIEKYCKHDDFFHAGVWSDNLKEAGDLYFEIVSLCGTEVCKIYDLYVSNFINVKLKEELDKPADQQDHEAVMFWMKEGCKYKSFYALRESCKYEVAKILNNESPDAEKEYAEHLDRNLDVISKLYMTTGYLYAAGVYYDLAKQFETQGDAGAAMLYYEKSAERFFYADEFSKKELSMDVVLKKLIGNESSIERFGFKSMQEAEVILLSKIPPTRHTHIAKYKRDLSDLIDSDIEDQKIIRESLPTPVRKAPS
jgi:DNA-binding protein Fis